MINEIKESLIEFQKCQDLNNWLRLFSILTWNKIGFARTRKRLKVYETTITQDLLFNFRLLAEESHLPIEIFESISERTNGNDFEILIEVENGYIMFPCQAKIIWSGDNYKAISHTVGSNYQINLLTNYAKRKKGIPIYLLYNYCENPDKYKEISSKIEFDIRTFGCSIVSAHYIKSNFFDKKKDTNGNNKWIIPTFYDLHPTPAIPFHQLTKVIGNKNLALNSIDFFYQEETTLWGKASKDHNIKVYSRTELLEDENWVNLVPLPQIGRIEPNAFPLNIINLATNDSQDFLPKFRLILSKKKKSEGVRVSYLD